MRSPLNTKMPRSAPIAGKHLLPAVVAFALHWSAPGLRADDAIEFFEKKVRPALVKHCYKCHSDDSQELEGELRLDLKAGWQRGGASGDPAVVPGQPDESPLIRAIRHDDDASAMPPRQPRLPEAVIRDLTAWVQMGAPDPRTGELKLRDQSARWEAEFARRLKWWSLQPVGRPEPPEVTQADWPRTEVDQFVLARLEAEDLNPVPEADRRVLLRRLSFALTGLPPQPDLVERFARTGSPDDYDQLVTTLLESPQFGEHWARHWMDVVHYADTHGYEWDVPAKNAWRFRDYLIRAFNADVPYRQLVLEQIAGDMIAPRIDEATGVNLSRIGPMMWRLGERRHGDNAQVEGVTQEAVASMIDTLGKGFLGTTLACAQCHDHKLDAVEQRDYYALAGVLMSTRFPARPVDAVDPNAAVIDELRDIKSQLRRELARLWLQQTEPTRPDGMRDRIRKTARDEKPGTPVPSTLAGFWSRSVEAPVTAEEFRQEQQRRATANRTDLTLLADFTREEGAGGWRWEGFGMKHGLASDGAIVVTPEGESAVQHILPAGRYSHLWSQRLAGVLHSPRLQASPPFTLSLEMVSGRFASQVFVVDRAINPERSEYRNHAMPAWQTLTAGNFRSLEGSIDQRPRRVYLELATKSLNNYFPARTNFKGISEKELEDPRSWFGVRRVFAHAAGHPPRDELSRFAPLFGELRDEGDWAARLTLLVRAAIDRWSREECTAGDVWLLNDALQSKLLSNSVSASPELAELVEKYREAESRLQPDRTVGSAVDFREGRDERLSVRGSYTESGESVPRGGPRFLRMSVAATDAATAAEDGTTDTREAAASGRLALARSIIAERNPLTARVYVNRVWHYLFGEGLVRTPDDFGHLGQRPTHPQLLDYLAARFMEEGWSTKKLIRLLVTSATWRQSSVADPAGLAIDPENRLWHHLPMRRLEAEAIRDSILAVSGRLDRRMFGPPVEPHRTAEDPMKRLFCGPLDGDGRRSIYLEMTLMEPPRFLALFNQPIPKQTVGRRDVTNMPDQALALLNDPFVIAMAAHWSGRLIEDDSGSPQQRIERMIWSALGRPARPAEVAGLVELFRRSTELRGVSGDLLKFQPAWQDAAHAIFNLKEFVYVP